MKSTYISQVVVQRMRKIQAELKQLDPEAEPCALAVPGSPQPRGNIIVLAGSFNPPTAAHLALLKDAHHAVRSHSSHKLYAAFAVRTVDKEAVERPLLLDRILLLQRVLRRFPQTGILLMNRGLYVEQAEGIRKSFPGVRQISFLMGYDKIIQIFDPHYYKDRDEALKQLFSLARLLVVPRGEGGDEEIQKLLQQPQNRQFASFVQPLPFSDSYRQVSSTHIRQNTFVKKRDIPREVKEFMMRTRAYAPPVVQADGTEIDYYEQRMRCLIDLVSDGK